MLNPLLSFLGIINIIAAIQLYWQGSFIRTKEHRVVYLCAAVFCIAELFKLQHWFGGSQLILIFWLTTILLAVLYLVYFLKKKRKRWTGVLKLIWMFTYFAGLSFRLLHWPYSYELTIISIVCMAVVYFHQVFFYEEPEEIPEKKPADPELLDQGID